MKEICKKEQPLVKVLALGAAFGVSALVPGTAEAQPNVGGGQGQNPPNQNPGGGNRPDVRTMTPEQRQQFFQDQQAARQERMIRGVMGTAGANNAAQQEAVITFSRAKDAATQSLQEMADKLVTAVSTMGVPDTEVARLLKEFQDAVAAEKERRKAARADLDKKINYSKQPRLEMMLTMLGLVGDDSLSMGNMGGRMFGGGGPGGFGGGPGGPGGGAAGGQGNAGRQN